MSSRLREQLITCALQRSSSESAEARVAAARTLFDFCGCVLGARGSANWTADVPAGLAVSAHLLDRDDLHYASVTHPGGTVWSAITACAVERRPTWGEVVEAAALGYELVVRVGEGLTAEHRRLWHATAVAGVIGAAAAAAKLLGGNHPTICEAVGHASSIASGSAQAQFERTGTRLVHRAYAASAGVLCARAACAGVGAIKHGFDQGRGAFAIPLSKSASSREQISALEQTGFRLHAATGFAHAAIDAALALAPVAPAQVKHLTVGVSPPGAVVLASNPRPTSDEEAWWSIEHATAVCLATGNPEALKRGLNPDGDVLRLCEMAEVYPLDRGWEATIEVSTVDGRTLRASVDVPLGHPAHPASNDDLCAKWLVLTGRDGASYLEQLLTARPQTSFASLLDESFGARLGSGSSVAAAPS